ncbi:MAG: heparinase II/III family protein [Bacteroidales bacterium]|nr:heparinase II/III family protein [Bacteroidales bacterium]
MSRAEEISADFSPVQMVFDASGLRMLETSRLALERLLFCSYAYRLTKDRRYLDHATFDLRTVCNFSSWNAERHFLDAAEMALGVGIAYDWLFDELSDDDRSAIVSALERNAFDPAADENAAWFYWSEGNWNQVCNAGLATAALAIRGDAKTDEKRDSTVQRILTDAIWSNRRTMETIYSPEGCYAEGPNYWSYGNMFQAILLSAFESATGSDHGLSSVEGFDKTARYKQLTYRPNGNISRPNGHIFNYSDNIDELKPAYPLWYFAWQFGDWSLIDQELSLLSEGKYSDSSEFRLLPLLMMYALRMPEDAASQQALSDEKTKTYVNYGTQDRLDDLPLMMVKGSDFYLGIKGGSPTTNHAHMDGGSFVYDAFGKTWAIDPSRASYTELEKACAEQGGDLWDMSQESLRWQFQTMSNEGHSTITVNGKNFNIKGKAIITETISPTSEGSLKATDDQYGAVMDLSSLYEGELSGAERRIWVDENGSLTVEDCLSALPGKNAEIRWSFVTPANVTISRKGIRLENEGTMVLLRTKSKARVSYRLFPSDSDAYSICGFEARVKGGEKVVFRSRLVGR